MDDQTACDITNQLRRIADHLEAIKPVRARAPKWAAHTGYIWRAELMELIGVDNISHLSLDLLLGIDLQKQQLLENTENFAHGYAANNALLWGARGGGKSSLVKSVHARVNEQIQDQLILVEILREDLASLGVLLDLLRTVPRKFLLFCDDLSFEVEDSAYKSLKAMLEGGIAGKPQNCLFYATSNRRHLMPREAMENEAALAIHAKEVVHEKVSLSDRFGLWLGFHGCDQDIYLAMVAGYIKAFDLPVGKINWKAQALAWERTRGNRSGRVAWQFILDLAGRLHTPLTTKHKE